jgi:hypothetical protein
LGSSCSRCGCSSRTQRQQRCGPQARSTGVPVGARGWRAAQPAPARVCVCAAGALCRSGEHWATGREGADAASSHTLTLTRSAIEAFLKPAPEELPDDLEV